MRNLRFPARAALLRAGLAALLLAAALSVALSVAPSSPVAHAEGHNCVWNEIAKTPKTLPGTNDVLTAYLYAQYDTYSGAYCGYVYGKVVIWVTKFNPGGKLELALYRQSGGVAYVTAYKSVMAAGGGQSGWPTPLETSPISIPSPNCAFTGGFFAGYSVSTPTRCP